MMICKRRKVVKIEQRMLASISLMLVICLPLCAQDHRGIDIGQEPSSQHTSESNAVVELPEITTSEVRKSLESSIAEMQAAVLDVKAFVARKGAERKIMAGFWRIEEQVVSDGKTIMRFVHFLSEEGPVNLAHKSVFEGEGAWTPSMREIRDQSYTLEFYPDGSVKRFVRRGPQRTDLRLYPSGGMMEYYVISGKVAVVSERWDESGKVKHAKHRGPDGQP